MATDYPVLHPLRSNNKVNLRWIFYSKSLLRFFLVTCFQKGRRILNGTKLSSLFSFLNGKIRLSSTFPAGVEYRVKTRPRSPSPVLMNLDFGIFQDEIFNGCSSFSSFPNVEEFSLSTSTEWVSLWWLSLDTSCFWSETSLTKSLALTGTLLLIAQLLAAIIIIRNGSYYIRWVFEDNSTV